MRRQACRSPRFVVIFALFLVFCLSAVPVRAQDEAETLIGGEVSHGGFGGPVVKVGRVAGSTEVLTGGRGGWIINVRPEHTIVLGGGGYGLATGIEEQVSDPDGGPGLVDRTVDMGYGGIELEYVNRTNALVHVSVYTLVGAGGLTLRDDENLDLEEEAFFVAEPQVSAMLNVTHFFRIGAGMSYRWTSGAKLGELGDGDLRGVAGVLTLKFGSF